MSTDIDTETDMATRPTPDGRVVAVHRIGATLVALVIAVFGVLGLLGGLAFFDTEGAAVMGMSTNGALSTVSLATAVVLVGAALRGGRLASTTMIVVGALFLVSAFANLAVLETAYNLLAFRLPNVFFSIGAGLVLLVLGAYGRLSTALPEDNPYVLDRHPGDVVEVEHDHQPRPRTAADHEVDAHLAEAERTVAGGGGSEALRRRLAAADEGRTQEERRALWRDHGD